MRIDRIEELCEQARIWKPEMYTSFVWLRALNHFKKSIADDLGVSERTLGRWETKAVKHLSIDERLELVALSVQYEYEERKSDNNCQVSTSKTR